MHVAIHVPPSAVVGRAILAATVMACALAGADDATIRPPAKGERIVFLGDSTTRQGAGEGGHVTIVKEAVAGRADAGKLLRHVVLFKFKDTSTPVDVGKIVTAFRALPGKIPQIKAFECGTDVSPEGKSQGFTHCFLITFASEADRDAYLPHPAHREFVSIVGPHVDKVCVVDYWSAP